MPLGEDAALRTTASFTRDPYSIRNGVDRRPNKDVTKSVRARLLWEPSDKLSVDLIADYSRLNEKGGSGWAVIKATPGSLLSDQLIACGITPSITNEFGCNNDNRENTYDIWGVSNTLNYDLGEYTLTSVTSYRGYENEGGADADSTLLDVLNINTSQTKVRNFSQELRLTSPNNRVIEYVLGAYYFNSDQQFSGQQAGGLGLLPPPLTVGQDFNTDAKASSYALFGQSTINASDKLRFLVGARLNQDKVEASTVRNVHTGSLAPFGSLSSVNGKVKDTSFSYRLGIQYDLSATNMAYITYNRGNKGPAINDQAPSPLVPIVIEPEVPNAWEVGLKSSLFDRRLVVNLAAFHTKTTNFQTQFYDPTLPGYIFGNAPELTTKGISADFFGRITDDLTFSGGIAFTDAEYGDGYLVTCSQQQTASQGCTTVPGGSTQDAGSFPLTGAPKVKMNLAFQYERQLTENFDGIAQADISSTSKIFYGEGFDPLNSTESHAIVGGRIGIKSQDDRWGLSIYARNLFDERVPNLVFAQPLAAQMGDPSAYVQFYSPDSFRNVGVTLDVNF